MLMLRPEAVTSSLFFMGSGSMGYATDYLGGQLLNAVSSPAQAPSWYVSSVDSFFLKDMMIQTYISMGRWRVHAHVCYRTLTEVRGNIQESVLVFYLVYWRWCLLLLLQLAHVF